MEYTDVDRALLSKLGLLPLKKWQLIRDIIKNGGTAYRYELSYPTHSERYVYFTFKPEGDMDGHYAGELYIADFNEITEELLRNEFMFTVPTIKKYMWLKRYLNGEVKGRYNRYDSTLLSSEVNAKMEQLQNKIGFLQGKIQRLEAEKEKLREQNNKLKQLLKGEQNEL